MKTLNSSISHHVWTWSCLQNISHFFFLTVHHIQEGIILLHFSRLLPPPLLIQKLIKSAVCSRIVHSVFVKLRKRFHSCVVNLQCRKRWLFVSPVSLHKKYLVTTTLPFFCRTSWCVRHALYTTSQVKHLTLVGAMLFQMFVHSPCITLLPLHILFTENIPSLNISISVYQIVQ